MTYVHDDANHSVIGDFQMEDPPQILRGNSGVTDTKEADT